MHEPLQVELCLDPLQWSPGQHNKGHCSATLHNRTAQRLNTIGACLHGTYTVHTFCSKRREFSKSSLLGDFLVPPWIVQKTPHHIATNTPCSTQAIAYRTWGGREGDKLGTRPAAANPPTKIKKILLGSNPGLLSLTPPPPLNVSRPGFESPTANFASAALPLDRR